MIAGDLKPGEWLKERELSERFEVSRVPVRQALQRLEVEAGDEPVVDIDLELVDRAQLLDGGIDAGEGRRRAGSVVGHRDRGLARGGDGAGWL
ncbi:MAG: GntR family transcriptional regulator [Gemmatimonadota bacterium]